MNMRLLLGILLSFGSVNTFQNKILEFSNEKVAEEYINFKDNNLIKGINEALGRGAVLDNISISDIESFLIKA